MDAVECGDKRELRKSVRELRKKLLKEECKREDLSIATQLMHVVEVVNPGIALLYMPLKGEPDIRPLIMHLWGNGIRTAVPLCVGENDIKFFEISDFDELRPGRFGILEPLENCGEVRCFHNSMCIVPGLAFDRFGNRLGNGKGYYDRFLSGYRYMKVGVCYSKFIMNRVPTEQGDIPMDLVVSGDR